MGSASCITAGEIQDASYVRVTSELNWAFADCGDLSVEADRQTLTAEDFERVMELLKFRPMQLAIVLKALIGVQEMERMMVQAIGVAKQDG